MEFLLKLIGLEEYKRDIQSAFGLVVIYAIAAYFILVFGLSDKGNNQELLDKLLKFTSWYTGVVTLLYTIVIGLSFVSFSMSPIRKFSIIATCTFIVSVIWGLYHGPIKADAKKTKTEFEESLKKNKEKEINTISTDSIGK